MGRAGRKPYFRKGPPTSGAARRLASLQKTGSEVYNSYMENLTDIKWFGHASFSLLIKTASVFITLTRLI